MLIGSSSFNVVVTAAVFKFAATDIGMYFYKRILIFDKCYCYNMKCCYQILQSCCDCCCCYWTISAFLPAVVAVVVVTTINGILNPHTFKLTPSALLIGSSSFNVVVTAAVFKFAATDIRIHLFFKKILIFDKCYCYNMKC